MKKTIIALGSAALISAAILQSCEDSVGGGNKVTYSYSFQENDGGWQAGFADLPSVLEDSTIWELASSWQAMPASIGTDRKGWKLQAHNRSDDIFMFLKKKIDGLKPNTRYFLKFRVQLASDAPTNMPGIGGAVAESVFLKGCASAQEPILRLDDLRYSRISIDKGNQAQEGIHSVAMGHIGVTDTTTVHTIIERQSTNTLAVTTNDKGELWLVVGTDSGFEGRTTLYYSSITVECLER